MELSPKNNWVEVLQNFSSHKEYEKLDKVDIANENSNHCNDLGSSDDEDKTLCKKVEQNLRRLSTLHGDELKSGCYYFQHWFFDNIAKKYYNGNDRGKNYAVAEKLFDIVSTLTPVYSKMEACKCYFEPGKPEDWKKEKYLHDYFENHEYINCSKSGKDSCEKYIQYVTYIKTLYENKEEYCCEEWYDYGFCKTYFKCDNKYNPQNLLTKLETELETLKNKIETVGEDETLQVGKSQNPGEEGGKEKTKPEISEAAALSRKEDERAAAKPSSEESGAEELGETKSETAELKETVSELESTKKEAPEEEANEELTAEEVVPETTSTLQNEETLGPPTTERAEHGVHAISYHTIESASNVVPKTITDSPNTLGSKHEELDSNFFRNVIMAIAVLGTILFLFYYNRSSQLESSLSKKKRKKGKIFENNYYEEYEKELAMYDSEETFLDSETDRLYLNYHADQDSYY